MGYAKRQRGKAKGVLAGMNFIPVQMEVLGSANFASLSPSAIKLLMALMAQIRPVRGDPAPNNGDLCAALNVLRRYGLRSQHTITAAKDELLSKGWIEITKQGGLGMGPTLYALTFWPIGECKGKLDVRPTRAASNTWRTLSPLAPKIKNACADSASAPALNIGA